VLCVIFTLGILCHASEGARDLPEAPSPPPVDTPNVTIPTSIWQLIEAEPHLSVLARLVKAADLVPLLNDTTLALTMFLPVNSAWENFLIEVGSTLEQLVADNSTISGLLEYHLTETIPDGFLVPGLDITMADLNNISSFQYWSGSTAIRDLAGRTIQVVNAPLIAGISVGYTTDRVFFPVRPTTVGEALEFNINFSVFKYLMKVSNNTALLNSSTANVTVMAPTNQAFSDALTKMNLTLSGLVKNATLLSNLVGAHIVTRVLPWQAMIYYAGYVYYNTLNPCAKFYSVESKTGAISLQGQGMLVGQSANVTQSDLIAGRFALIQAIDAVLLPLHRYGGGCITSPWKPPRS